MNPVVILQTAQMADMKLQVTSNGKSGTDVERWRSC